MDGAAIIYMVGIDCKPQYEEEFNTWYDKTHIPLLLKFKGLKRVSRYRLSNSKGTYPAYLAVYEFSSKEIFEEYAKSPERTAALEEMRSRWSAGEWEIQWQTQYELLRKWGN